MKYHSNVDLNVGDIWATLQTRSSLKCFIFNLVSFCFMCGAGELNVILTVYTHLIVNDMQRKAYQSYLLFVQF